MTLLLGLLVARGALVVVGLGLRVAGAARWAELVRTHTRVLESGRVGAQGRLPSPERFDADELEGLPDPVQRYLRAVLTDGQPIIAAATIEMTGTVNMSASAELWKPFSSRQRATLTVITVLGLPINVCAGLLGMNVGSIPFEEKLYGFAVIVVLRMVFMALAGWLAFRRREQLTSSRFQPSVGTSSKFGSPQRVAHRTSRLDGLPEISATTGHPRPAGSEQRIRRPARPVRSQS